MQPVSNDQSSTTLSQDPKTSRKPRVSKLDALAPFHDKIVAWRQEEKDLRAIAALLADAGCPVTVDHNVVSRYAQKHSIPFGKDSAAVTEQPPKAEAPPHRELERPQLPFKSTDSANAVLESPTVESAPVKTGGIDAPPREHQDATTELFASPQEPAQETTAVPVLLARLHLADLAALNYVNYADTNDADVPAEQE
jgi:hypothetical protein